MHVKNTIAAILFIILGQAAAAQVKIGGAEGAPNAKAVLELSDTARGFLLPRLSQVQMHAIATPPDGLLVYNSTARSIYQFKESNGLWMPLRSDSSDWFLDTSSAKLYLKYGLANQDSIYYHTAKKKFLFTDTRFYTLSSGNTFNLDEGNSDKYIFKVTASRFPRDPVNLNSAAIYTIYEVDNDTVAVSHPFESTYNGLGVDATVNRLATQKIDALYGTRIFTTHSGLDSINVINGILNSTLARVKGMQTC